MENWRDMKVVKREPLSHTKEEGEEFDKLFWSSVDSGFRPNDNNKGGVRALPEEPQEGRQDGCAERPDRGPLKSIEQLTAELRSRYE